MGNIDQQIEANEATNDGTTFLTEAQTNLRPQPAAEGIQVLASNEDMG